LERFQFGLIRVLLDQKALTYEQLQKAMQELDQAEDIEVYWGVREKEAEVSDIPPQ